MTSFSNRLNSRSQRLRSHLVSYRFTGIAVKELGTSNESAFRSTVGSNDEIPFEGSARPMSAADVVALQSGSTIQSSDPVSYTHLRAHETGRNLVCRLLLEK